MEFAFAGTFRVYVPRMSVDVPTVVSLTITVAPATGDLVAESVTVPVTIRD